MLQAATAGFALGLSLIVAIGAQNAFVLRQGLLRRHVFAICLTCAVSDALLIAVGVGGFGWLVSELPWLATAMRWGGATFLLAYGIMAFRAAWRGTGALRAASDGVGALGSTILTCLALTWLNPHVYLDTVVLLGSVAATWGPGKLWFGIGAMAASFIFFFALGYGARMLAPVFARPAAWRVLDVLVGVLMTALAVGLILE